MAKDKENTDFINEKEEDLNRYRLKDFINGSVLMRIGVFRQLPFVIFVAIIGIIYIANRYHAEYILRETVRLQSELEELRAESITIASELMFASQQSQVLKLVQEKDLNLKESRVPPVRIKMKD